MNIRQPIPKSKERKQKEKNDTDKLNSVLIAVFFIGVFSCYLTFEAFRTNDQSKIDFLLDSLYDQQSYIRWVETQSRSHLARLERITIPNILATVSKIECQVWKDLENNDTTKDITKLFPRTKQKPSEVFIGMNNVKIERTTNTEETNE